MKAWRIGPRHSLSPHVERHKVSGTFPHDRCVVCPFVFCTAVANSSIISLVTWSCERALPPFSPPSVRPRVLGRESLVTISPAFCDPPNNWVAARSRQLAVNLVRKTLICYRVSQLRKTTSTSIVSFRALHLPNHIWKWSWKVLSSLYI
jgi:hypothetical protein